jgi:anaerobic magnesium-protoporphyrin IX monomethyl ester cyclase
MKVALVRPNYHTHLITPPLGLGYLSAYLKSKNIKTKIIDGLNLGLTNQEIVEKLEDCEMVGISVLTDYYLQAKDLTARLKKANKIVVWGGTHATILPKEVLQETQTDFVVVGEGEISLHELVQAIANGSLTKNIPGVYSRATENFTSREFIKDLDSLPFPDWEAIDPRTYQKAPHGALIKNFPVAPVTSSRGCPYSCTFCASPKVWGKQIRYRSPKNVLDEIEYLAANFGVKEIHFEDDNLTLKREHVESICQGIIDRRLNISWATPNGIRADKVDKNLLQLMKAAGCYYVVFGVESGNQEILNNIKKHESLVEIEKAIRLASEVGLMTQGFFIFGLPGETEGTIQNTINFAKRVPLDRAQFLLLDLIPGSELWDEHHTEIKYDYTKQSYHDTTWIPSSVSREELLAAQPRAFKQFFFRPRPVWSLIRHLKPAQLGFILRRLKDFRIFK